MNKNSIVSPLISIIIPVYEGKEYFSILLKSLTEQTLDNIEIICVDDCGSDGAFDVALAKARTDTRIICLRNNHNVGQGICRNMALSVARGEYIAFADSDDLIPPDFYEQLYNKAKETGCAVVKGQRVAVFPDGRHEYSALNLNIATNIDKYALVTLFNWEHQSAIFLRSVLEEKGARNAEGRRDQDTAFLLCMLYGLNRNDFAFAPNAVYYYRKHSDAVTANINNTYLVELLKSFKFKLDFLKTKPIDLQLLRYVENQAEVRSSNRLCEAISCNTITDEQALQYLSNLRDILLDFNKYHQFSDNMGAVSKMLLLPNVQLSDILLHCKQLAKKKNPSFYSARPYLEADSSIVRNTVYLVSFFSNDSVSQGIVMLTSLLENKNNAVQYELHIFIDRVLPFYLNVLINMQRPNFRIILHEETDGLYNSTPLSERCNLICATLHQRLSNIDQILFLSPHLIICKDIAPLASLDIGDACIAGVYNMDEAAFFPGVELLNLNNIYKSNVAYTAGMPWMAIYPDKLIKHLHVRYNTPILELCEKNSDIRFFNKQFGSFYQSVQELMLDSVIQNYNIKISDNSRTFSAEVDFPLYLKYYSLSPIAAIYNKHDKYFAQLKQNEKELSKLQYENVATINRLNRELQLHIIYPKLRKKYRLLKLRKFFSWGGRRRKYKEKIRELRTLLREYRYESSKMWDNRGFVDSINS